MVLQQKLSFCRIFLREKNMIDRGGSKLGGAHLKILRRAEGGAKIFGVFRVKNHDFTQKKSYFFPILGGGAHAWCAFPWIRP